MKFCEKNVEYLKKIVEYIRSGQNTPQKLSELTGVSKRQVYRYLNFGMEQGFIYSPTRGAYFPSDVKVVPFETYAILNSKNVNVRMSQNIQHNKTEHVPNAINLFKINSNKSKETKSEELKEKLFTYQVENVTTPESTSHMSRPDELRNLIIQVLRIAQMPYGSRDLRYAENSLRECAWWLVNESNIEAYTIETITRMSERLTRVPDAVKTNAVGYFFGIFSRVVSSDTKVIMKQWRSLLVNCSQVAVGMAEMCSTDEVDDSHYEPVSNQDIPLVKSKSPSIKIVPEKWLVVRDLLNEVINDFSAYSAKQLEGPVSSFLVYLDNQDAPVQNIEAAIKDAKTHDKVATGYFVRLLHSQLFEAVQEQLDRHYRRSITRALRGINSSDDGIGQTRKMGDKYAAFYQLFPDARE